MSLTPLDVLLLTLRSYEFKKNDKDVNTVGGVLRLVFTFNSNTDLEDFCNGVFNKCILTINNFLQSFFKIETIRHKPYVLHIVCSVSNCKLSTPMTKWLKVILPTYFLHVQEFANADAELEDMKSYNVPENSDSSCDCNVMSYLGTTVTCIHCDSLIKNLNMPFLAYAWNSYWTAVERAFVGRTSYVKVHVPHSAIHLDKLKALKLDDTCSVKSDGNGVETCCFQQRNTSTKGSFTSKIRNKIITK